MKCSAWSSLAISVCSGLALLFAGTASAHVIAMPTYVATGSSQVIVFSVPNERQRPMTSFAISLPKGLEIEHVHPVDGWTEQSTASTATWTGGSLAPRAVVPFQATLKATAEPGLLDVQAEQRYPDGGIVSWPVELSILPAKASPSQNLALAGVVGLIGVLLVVAVAMLAWRRRSLPPAGDT